MTYRGRVQNGVVVIDDESLPPEGAEVEVRLTNPQASKDHPSSNTTVGQRLLRFAGCAVDLPADASENHDAYLYGPPAK